MDLIITNNKYQKALVEIERVVYGKIKHLNNQGRILHIAEILSKVIADGKFTEEQEQEKEKNILKDKEKVKNCEDLNLLYKEFYDACYNAGYYGAKADDLEQKIDQLKKK
jgi:uncharacterized tellurite resistance protein B-like protein